MLADDLLDPAGLLQETVLLDGLEHGERRRRGDGVAAVGAPEAARVHGVHHLGAAGDAGERHAAGDALGGRHQVRLDALGLGGEPGAGAGDAGLDLVRDEQDVVGLAPLDHGRQEALGRDDEAALALDRLHDHGGQVVGTDLLLQRGDGALRGLGAGQAVPQRVGAGHAVDLGGERSEAVLVGHGLGGQRHRQGGAAVIGVVERGHGLLAGVGAGHLDGVLHGLGAGIEQGGAGLAGDRAGAVQLLGHGHVALVGRDHERGVGELRDLLLDGGHDARVGGAHGGDGDAGGQIDQAVAVHVLEDAARGAGRVHRHRGGHAGWDGALLALGELTGAWAGQLGGQMAGLLEVGGGGHGDASWGRLTGSGDDGWARRRRVGPRPPMVGRRGHAVQ
ncbi:Uncharacterised protein [Streptococcus pneumoniae]|nr:Uncharacterised protein [Streptococcus pneumoniae]